MQPGFSSGVTTIPPGVTTTWWNAQPAGWGIGGVARETSHILVVADELPIRRLVCRTLKQNGFRVIEVETAEAALPICRDSSRNIELVIVDIRLPGMSGLDLAAELERLDSPPRILYLSGCRTSIAIQSMILGCAPAVLLKPFTELNLLGRVRFLLQGGYQPEPATSV